MDASKLTVHEADLLGEGGFARVFKATIDLGARHGGEQEVAFKAALQVSITFELTLHSSLNLGRHPHPPHPPHPHR